MDCADLDFTPSGVDSLAPARAKSRAQQTMNLKLDRTAVVLQTSPDALIRRVRLRCCNDING